MKETVHKDNPTGKATVTNWNKAALHAFFVLSFETYRWCVKSKRPFAICMRQWCARNKLVCKRMVAVIDAICCITRFVAVYLHIFFLLFKWPLNNSAAMTLQITFLPMHFSHCNWINRILCMQFSFNDTLWTA